MRDRRVIGTIRHIRPETVKVAVSCNGCDKLLMAGEPYHIAVFLYGDGYISTGTYHLECLGFAE